MPIGPAILVRGTRHTARVPLASLVHPAYRAPCDPQRAILRIAQTMCRAERRTTTERNAGILKTGPILHPLKRTEHGSCATQGFDIDGDSVAVGSLHTHGTPA